LAQDGNIINLNELDNGFIELFESLFEKKLEEVESINKILIFQKRNFKTERNNEIWSNLELMSALINKHAWDFCSINWE